MLSLKHATSVFPQLTRWEVSTTCVVYCQVKRRGGPSSASSTMSVYPLLMRWEVSGANMCGVLKIVKQQASCKMPA